MDRCYWEKSPLQLSQTVDTLDEDIIPEHVDNVHIVNVISFLPAVSFVIGTELFWLDAG